jgi:hypothetical protein
MQTGVALCGFWARKWLKKLEVESLVKPHEAHLEPPASEKVKSPASHTRSEDKQYCPSNVSRAFSDRQE